MGITVYSLFIMQDLYHPLHWLCSKHTKSQVGCYAIGTTVEQLGSFFLLYIHIYICISALPSYEATASASSATPRIQGVQSAVGTPGFNLTALEPKTSLNPKPCQTLYARS